MQRLVSAILIAAACSPSIIVAQEEPAPFTILIANDDGYEAPGLVALIDSLMPIARVVVAAPAQEESGMGHAITYREPILVRTVPNEKGVIWYAVGARPATVVRLALVSLLEEKPDLVVSGINSNANIGLDAWVSGTVAAAREAAFMGIPTLAVSRGGGASYEAAAGFVRSLVEDLRGGGLLDGPLFLNVNIPRGIAQGVKGIRVVSLNIDAATQQYVRYTSPRGQVFYWDRWAPPTTRTPDTDLTAFVEGYVTITPFRIDQTDGTRLAEIRTAIQR